MSADGLRSCDEWGFSSAKILHGAVYRFSGGFPRRSGEEFDDIVRGPSGAVGVGLPDQEGLAGILEYVRRGESLDELLIGKIASPYRAVLKELCSI